MLRLFDCLETEPNVLFRDSYREGGRSLSASEQALLRQYRGLSLKGRETVRSVVDALCAYRDEVEETGPEKQEPRVIPLYRNPAGGRLCLPGVRRGLRLYPRYGGRSAGGGVRRSNQR